MMILISGGSGSGKSAFAEAYITQRAKASLYYIATMKLWDGECEARVQKHREMRADKNFTTLECPEKLENLILPDAGCVLLEDLSNLVANEYFGGFGAEMAGNRVISGIKNLNQQSDLLVIVTNELFSDGIQYDGETTKYLKLLAKLNRQIAKISDEVYEVVAGIPVCVKGEF